MRGSKAVVVLAAAATLMLPVRAEAGTTAETGAAGTAATAAGATTGASAGASAAPTPASVATKLFRAWLRDDRAAAAAVASPAAVKTLFAYVYRAPDKSAACVKNACRFVHTSVRVPGGLNGILMVVSGSKVAKVYESRHITSAAKAARYFFAAWKAGDRNRGLEVGSSAAVKTLFKAKFGGVGYMYQGCQAETGGQSCAYSYEGGAMFLHMRGSKARGYEVRSISYIAD
ncbi:hypothetical protein DQ384_33890 [Sphaerisporangium album]|uniref:Uncharacterized protein n=1 Tax=Sphaerisporangium album TaxID=509200 RepID=A0A367F3G3_9ACTN|nr:hypothetical protein [Sphaerisporangium album]RCG24040.1 hypothetical protein DQ384_33890 [Sphaerisporangium album]